MRPFRFRVAIVLTVLIAGGIAAYVWRGAGPGGVATVSGVRPAPDFRLPDAQGHDHRLADFRGQLVVVHFWASWCAPCLTELPVLAELARKWEGRGLQIVAISLDDRWSDAQKVLREEGRPPALLSLIDLTKQSADDYGSYQYPESYLINGRGQVVLKLVGAQEWLGAPMQGLLERLRKAAGALPRID